MLHKVFSFRLDEQTYQKLGSVADFHLRSRGNLLRMLVQSEFLRLGFENDEIPTPEEIQACRNKIRKGGR